MLGRGGDEAFDIDHQLADDLLRRCSGDATQRIDEQVLAKFLPGDILGFDNSIGIDSEQIACT